jgi:hypothetical protein
MFKNDIEILFGLLFAEFDDVYIIYLIAKAIINLQR